MLKPVDKNFVNSLAARLPDGVLLGPEPRYLSEPRGRWQGQAGIVACPKTVDQVSVILAACHAAHVPVIPYGGGTGLVGGQLSEDLPAPLILSLERMNAVRDMFPTENVMIVEAGAILTDVQAAALDHDRLFPLSIAAEGSARIGGCLATNAGGVNVLRYGNTRDLCLGLEVVLPDGRIWNGLTRLRKDNTGYDLRNLMIGSEGTLGVITAAALKLAPRPVNETTALFVVRDPQSALDLLALARTHLAEGISAFELMGRAGLEFLAETMPEMRLPFDPFPDWFVLIDVGLGRGGDPAVALETLFSEGCARGLAVDALIAQSETQREEFWAVRETIPTANRRIGSVSSHDISLPLSAIPEFIETAPAHLAQIDAYRINCFGHLGDGNLHYNVFPQRGYSRTDHEHQRDKVKRAVHDLVHQMGGSISAEHGIGRLKVGDLERYGNLVKLDMIRAVKSAIDPRGIMNPGAVLA